MGDKKYIFQKLTPVSDADISVYEEAIDFVFDNEDIKNVAISGAYSAGKSSILESYKKKHKNTRFVHLSLAHFRTPEQENSEAEDSVKESVLEGKILNQLIHQISADKIPQTNFRVKKGVKPRSIACLTVMASLFIGSIVFLLSTSQIDTFISALPENWLKSVLSVLISPYAPIPAALICVACTVVFLFGLIKAQKNRNVLRKISLQGNEIEIFEDQDDSYFDKYLNEVLYLFENVEADVVVFEDMDRFNASRIFERLREVNTLVNIQRKKEQSDKFKPLRFFYLLRDDIFVSKDRTKFFDYIVPIVPVVDGSNSYEQFLKHLKEGNLLERFDQSFLQSLSLYVDDMRILKNIYNEFIVYIHRLNTTDLNWDKMMAIIAYKNLFPRDFNDLQLARGFVYTLFEQKPRLIEASLASAQERRQAMLDRIEWAKKESLTSQQELTDAYAAKNSRLSNQRNVNYQERNRLLQQYADEESQRKQAIQDNSDENLPKLYVQLAEVERDIFLTKTKSLQALITKENIDRVFTATRTNEIDEVNEFKEIKGSDYFALLKYLIRNGYIDETYTDYMTYFYEDSISANDKTFLRRITDRRGKEYTYSLREPRKVIDSPILRAVEFEQEETLNFDLLECLLLNDAVPKNALYLKTLISQIRETVNFGFISMFIETGKAYRQLVIRINEQWPDFFCLALRGNTIPSAQIRNHSVSTLYFSNEETIQAVNSDNCLSDYISNGADYLEIEQPDIERLIAGFSLIGVSFVKIDYDKADRALFDEVYQNSLYSISFENIAMMLEKQYGIENDFDITHKNYTLVQSNADSPLAEYVSENMSAYIEIILTECDGNITDDESIVINLLNNTDVKDDAKEQYVDYLSTVISDITQVTEPALWSTMINHEVVAFSAENFICYFKEHGIDETLTVYINNEPANVDFTTTSEKFGEEIAESLYDAVAVCNGISTDKYRKVLMDLGYYFDSFDCKDISNEKFKVLIDEKILQMDASGLEFVREKYESHLFDFIKHNLDKYLELQNEEIFNLEEALNIIAWDFADDRKIKLLELTSQPISVAEKSYSDAVTTYILGNNLQVSDKPNLYANYSEFGTQAKECIVQLAIAGVQEIITRNIEVDDKLLSALLQSDDVTDAHKIMLFTMAIPNLNEDTCKAHFDELGLSELSGIFSKSGGRRNYEKSADVKTVLDALKVHEWIYDYHDDDRNSAKYIVIKNRPRNEPEILD
jgi:hypothetical protein